MNEYVLMLHENPAQYAQVSPAEMQAIIERYAAWARAMGERGSYVRGDKLADDGGRHLRLGKNGLLASDALSAEAKDVIGGYFVLQAESMAAVEALAATCPHLHGDNWIELRQIEPT
jgi:hypothetical protein